MFGFSSLFFCIMIASDGTENQTVTPCLLMKEAGATS